MDIVVTIQRNLKVEVENPAYQKKKNLLTLRQVITHRIKMECLSRPGKEHNTEDRMCNNTYAVSDTTIKTNIRVLKVHFELGSHRCVFLNGNHQKNV